MGKFGEKTNKHDALTKHDGMKARKGVKQAKKMLRNVHPIASHRKSKPLFTVWEKLVGRYGDCGSLISIIPPARNELEIDGEKQDLLRCLLSITKLGNRFKCHLTTPTGAAGKDQIVIQPRLRHSILLGKRFVARFRPERLLYLIHCGANVSVIQDCHD